MIVAPRGVYFGDKRGLAYAALSAAADELIQRLDVDPEQPAPVQLASGLATYLDYLAQNPVNWSALINATTKATPELDAIARRVDDYTLLLSYRALRVDSAPVALELALRGWLELVKSVCLSWLTTQTPDRATVHTLLAAAFVGCVEAAAAADPSCAPAAAAVRQG